MNLSKTVLNKIDESVGTFLSRPTYDWGADGSSVILRFSDTRTMREAQGYIENLRQGIKCSPWFPDTEAGKDPFTGVHAFQVTWKDGAGNDLPNAKKAIQFVIAKWKMAKIDTDVMT
jgi:hypothetical protein